MEVTEGEAACFTVAVTGRPSPRVKWQHNGNDIVEGGSPYFEVTHSSDGLHHSLRIGEVFADDAGIVCVTADNEAGAVSTSAHLTVRSQFYDYSLLTLSESNSSSLICFSPTVLHTCCLHSLHRSISTAAHFYTVSQQSSHL